MVKSACGIEAVYMCFNGTGIWGGETMWILSAIFKYIYNRFCFVISGLQNIHVDIENHNICELEAGYH